MLLGLKNFKCPNSLIFSSLAIIAFQKLWKNSVNMSVFSQKYMFNFEYPSLKLHNRYCHKVCHVDFPFKVFDKMVNKREFLKTINLYLLPSHPWKNPLPNPPRLENLVPNPRKLKNEVPTFLQMTKWTRVWYRIQIQTQMMKVMLWTLVIFRLFFDSEHFPRNGIFKKKF